MWEKFSFPSLIFFKKKELLEYINKIENCSRQPWKWVTLPFSLFDNNGYGVFFLVYIYICFHPIS